MRAQREDGCLQPSSEVSGEPSPAHSLIVDFQPLDCEIIRFCY